MAAMGNPFRLSAELVPVPCLFYIVATSETKNSYRVTQTVHLSEQMTVSNNAELHDAQVYE
jgi:hypothetical protein